MRMMRCAVLIVAMLLAGGRAASAQVDGHFSYVGPDPFDYYPYDPDNFSDYVAAEWTSWWDTSVYCGYDGGCMGEIWCTADSVDTGVYDENGGIDCPHDGVCGGEPNPSDGWASVYMEDYGHARDHVHRLHVDPLVERTVGLRRWRRRFPHGLSKV